MSAEPHSPGFVPSYLRARAREDRLFTDDVVRVLPDLPAGDPHAAEWRLRGDTAARFVDYLGRVDEPVRLVDIGCGNGWFTALVASRSHVSAVGIDVNEQELFQARRVFGGRPRVDYVLGDFSAAVELVRRLAASDAPESGPRPVVTLVSSLQYVADAAALLESLLRCPDDRIEVHVLDTPVYAPGAIDAARSRTRRHYEELGVPEMAERYHHHAWSLFDQLRDARWSVDVLYDPSTTQHRFERRVLQRARSPFPWIRLTRCAS